MTVRFSFVALAFVCVLASACGSDSSVVEAGAGTASAETTGTSGTVEPVLTGGPVLASTALSVDHGCGFGFAKGSVDQTISMVVFFTGDWTETGPSLDESIELGPGSAWSAQISVGENLFANWCDDVIEEDEPTPRIDQEFQITQGTLVGSVDNGVASATLTNVVAVPVGDGDIVEWAEVELRNEAWGFFAG